MFCLPIGNNVRIERHRKYVPPGDAPPGSLYVSIRRRNDARARARGNSNDIFNCTRDILRAARVRRKRNTSHFCLSSVPTATVDVDKRCQDTIDYRAAAPYTLFILTPVSPRLRLRTFFRPPCRPVRHNRGDIHVRGVREGERKIQHT